MLGDKHYPLSANSGEDFVALHALWAEVANFPACDATKGLLYFLREICALMGGSDATWLVMRKQKKLPRDLSSDQYQKVFEQMQGWSPVSAVYLNPEKEFSREANRWFTLARKEGVDPMTNFSLSGAGQSSRALIRHDVMTDTEWANHWMPQKYLKFYGVGERMIALNPINHECESSIIIDRPLDADPFTAKQRDLLHYATTSVPQLHRRLFLERGIINSSALLSNRETDTYRLLLTESSESEIAEILKLSIHTVHDYARHLYKKFGVKGRIGLMALVLGA